MVSEGKGCVLGLVAIAIIIFLPSLLSKYINNARANRLLLQFHEIEQLFKQEGLRVETLNSSKNVSHGLGSARDCLYSASRSYKLLNTEMISPELTTKLSALKLSPHKARADGKFNYINVEPSKYGVSITIEGGQWETSSALFDFRCG